MMSETLESIGVIGVGLVGSVLVDHCVDAGLAVYGYDPGNPRSQQGRRCVSSIEVCQNCRTVFLSLPNSDIVESVLKEVRSVLTDEHVIIDTTTGDPEDAVRHQTLLTDSGADLVEATIAGSSDLLRKREAGIFLGGGTEVIARVQPLLDFLSDQCEHLGPLGAASRFKLVFNLVLGLNRAVLAEALHFGEALGFDANRTLRVLAASPARTGVMATKGRKMIEADYEPPQARLSQHLKDVRLMLAEAERKGAHTPLTATHRSLLEAAENLGFGQVDTSAVIEAYRLAD